MDTDTIIEHLEQYTSQQLASFIQAGDITLDELQQTGAFPAKKQKEVKALLDRAQNAEALDWEQAQSAGTIEAINTFLQHYPAGKYRTEAQSLLLHLQAAQKPKPKAKLKSWEIGIDSLRKRILEIQAASYNYDQKESRTIQEIKTYLNDPDRKVGKQDFLNMMEKDLCLLPSGTIRKLIVEEHILEDDDLYQIGVSDNILQLIYAQSASQNYTAVPPPPQAIGKQSTEVYFWGIPSSGKSCAIGAILHEAQKGDIAVLKSDSSSQGYGYLNFITGIFGHYQGKAITLPGGTPVTSFYEMGLDFMENGRIHPVTCIDMAGELIRCMYDHDTDPGSMTDTDTDMLDTMHRLLVSNRSVNRKVHVFVIEYGADQKLYNGKPQSTYLDGAINYIERTGILKKETDDIYIMLTKVDKAPLATPSDLRRYINDHYRNFKQRLDAICKANDIGNGAAKIIAFSLGKVCFQHYCELDPSAARNALSTIFLTTASYKSGKRSKALQKLKG
ncbi:MAG: hypothetical protein IJU19_08780 [Bacteroidales bacterium]|nr:hypothetical protein [Bacteroidales bacterium]